jgi:hypothetical protein
MFLLYGNMEINMESIGFTCKKKINANFQVLGLLIPKKFDALVGRV